MVKLSVNYERTNECLCVQKAETFICLAKTRDPNYAFACEKGRERERERERMEHNTRRRRQGGKCRWQRVEIGKLSARKKPQKRTNDCSI